MSILWSLEAPLTRSQPPPTAHWPLVAPESTRISLRWGERCTHMHLQQRMHDRQRTPCARKRRRHTCDHRHNNCQTGSCICHIHNSNMLERHGPRFMATRWQGATPTGRIMHLVGRTSHGGSAHAMSAGIPQQRMQRALVGGQGTRQTTTETRVQSKQTAASELAVLNTTQSYPASRAAVAAPTGHHATMARPNPKLWYHATTSVRVNQTTDTRTPYVYPTNAVCRLQPTRNAPQHFELPACLPRLVTATTHAKHPQVTTSSLNQHGYDTQLPSNCSAAVALATAPTPFCRVVHMSSHYSNSRHKITQPGQRTMCEARRRTKQELRRNPASMPTQQVFSHMYSATRSTQGQKPCVHGQDY
jgi:hypothetical protein